MDYVKIERDRLVGKKVLCRSNESEPLWAGELIGWEHTHSSYLPMVKNAQGEIFVCMGIVLPYSDEMLEVLSKKTPKEQYKFLCELRNDFMTLSRRG
jgi:hypothetical protein